MADFAGAPLAFPARFGRFELLAVLGVGGMATVFLARARGLHGFERHVALKVMHPHLRLEASWTRQFVTEAKIAAALVHPNVVAVTDVGEEASGVYLVMNYIEGDSLSGLMKEAAHQGERLPLGVALRILVDALAGLHAAHEMRESGGRALGLVHRDFSPQNVLVGSDGIARLTDFGIAKTAATDRTRTGLVKGKLAYMSREQVRGEPLDRRSDVWAGGVVAWELVTGQRLYTTDEDEMATVLRVASSTPPRVRSVSPDVPEAVDQAIADALQPKREARIGTAEAFRSRLLETGLVADPSEVSRYVAHAARSRIDALRAHTLAVSGERVRPARADEVLAHTEALTQLDVLTLPAMTTPSVGWEVAPRRWRRALTYAAVGLLGAAAAGATLVGWGRGPAGPAGDARVASAAVSAVAAVAPTEIASPSVPIASAPTATATVDAPAALAHPPPPATVQARLPIRRSTRSPANAATNPPSHAPARKPLLADPLDER